MPSPAISKSLSALLPSLPTPPPRLLNTAESLLALSRQRAAHLKPEEEIARAFACCEIACDRLRAQLRLPPTKKGGAPCKPVAYRKLFGYLEGVLGNDGGNTPGKRKREDLEIQETPTKRSRHTEQVTPSKSSGKRDGGFLGKIKASSSGQKQTSEAPDFVMPAIRRLCKTFSTPEMAPQVYTGTCIVLKLSNLWPSSSGDAEALLEAEATALLVALYLMVLTRMQRGKMTTKIFKGISSRAVDMFETVSGAQQIESWIKKINSEGYCKGQDWWDSVPEGVFSFSIANLEGADETVHDDEGILERPEDPEHDEGLSFGRRKGLDLDQDDPEGVLLPGLGTMMSDAVDWLSDERRSQFKTWKLDLIKQMDRATAAA